MENVTCYIEIELTDADDRFGDTWNFEISIYRFAKISEQRVKVEFVIQDEVTRVDEDGVTSHGLSDWSEAYVIAEENLQTLLDIITLDRSGIGIRIVPDSLLQSSPNMRDLPTENLHSVNLPDLDAVEERFNRLIAGGEPKLYDALRMHRLAANEDNTGEKIGQLWGVAEVLYASASKKILDTKAKKKEIRDLIDQATLVTKEEKERLKNMVINTDAKSIPQMIAENLQLSDGEGNKQSIEDTQAKVSDWRNVRSPQAHGNVLMRDREAHRLASEMEHLLEQVLSAEINPSRYIFIIFLPSNMKDAFSANNKSKIDPGGSEYHSRGIHMYASMQATEIIRYNLKESDSVAYAIDYKSITRIGSTEEVLVELSECPEAARGLIRSRMNFLNKVAD